MGRPKVLLIDDNDAYVESLQSLLAEMFDVTHAANGVDGLIGAVRTRPDLILLDVNMPGMDGLETLKKIRKASWGKKIPVLLLASFRDDGNLQRAIEFETTDFLIKDQWTTEDIVQYVQKILSP